MSPGTEAKGSIRDARAVFRKWLERARPPDRKIPPSKANHSRLPRDEPLWEKPPLAPSPEAEALWEKCKELLKDRVTRHNLRDLASWHEGVRRRW